VGLNVSSFIPDYTLPVVIKAYSSPLRKSGFLEAPPLAVIATRYE